MDDYGEFRPVGFLDRFKSSALRPHEVLRRMLLVPTPEGHLEEIEEDLSQNREVSLLLTRDERGRSVVPAFTSEEALRRWEPQGSAYVTLEGRVLVTLLAGSDWDRIVVDCADSDPLVITRPLAGKLVGIASYSVPAGSTVLIGAPSNAPPEGLVEILRRVCKRDPAITEAYLYQVALVDREEPPHLALGLMLDPAVGPAEGRRIAQSIADEVEPRAWGYEFVDVQLLDGDLLDAVRLSEGVQVLI